MTREEIKIYQQDIKEQIEYLNEQLVTIELDPILKFEMQKLIQELIHYLKPKIFINSPPPELMTELIKEKLERDYINAKK